MKKNLLISEITMNEMEKLQRAFVESNNVSMVRNYLAPSDVRIAHVEIMKETLKEDSEAYNELVNRLENLVEKESIFKLFLAFRRLYFENVPSEEIVRFVKCVKMGKYSVEKLVAKYILMGEYGCPRF